MPEDELTEMLHEGRQAFAYQFQWTPDLSVGVEKIDSQHKAWIKRVNELCKSILVGKGAEELGSLMDFLADYARWHFRDEESLMLEHNYPGYDEHRRAHQNLANEVQAKTGSVMSGQVATDSILSILSDLYNWFSDHMKEKDRVFGDWLREVSNEKEE